MKDTPRQDEPANGEPVRTIPNPAGNRRSRTAFTLVELLVVIAIISVLISLLMPSLGLVRGRARGLTCQTHLRQLGAALHVYAGDNQGAIPPRSYLGFMRRRENYPLSRLVAWHSRLIQMGYLDGNSDVFYCPSFIPYNRAQATRNPATTMAETYGMRVWTEPDRGFAYSHVDRQLTWIKDPSDFFLLADSIWMDRMTQFYGLHPGAGGTASNQQVRLSHEARANALFADGGVASKESRYFTELASRQPEYHGGSTANVLQTWLHE